MDLEVRVEVNWSTVTGWFRWINYPWLPYCWSCEAHSYAKINRSLYLAAIGTHCQRRVHQLHTQENKWSYHNGNSTSSNYGISSADRSACTVLILRGHFPMCSSICFLEVQLMDSSSDNGFLLLPGIGFCFICIWMCLTAST